jgi:hypothetical protein
MIQLTRRLAIAVITIALLGTGGLSAQQGGPQSLCTSSIFQARKCLLMPLDRIRLAPENPATTQTGS